MSRLAVSGFSRFIARWQVRNIGKKPHSQECAVLTVSARRLDKSAGDS